MTERPESTIDRLELYADEEGNDLPWARDILAYIAQLEAESKRLDVMLEMVSSTQGDYYDRAYSDRVLEEQDHE